MSFKNQNVELQKQNQKSHILRPLLFKWSRHHARLRNFCYYVVKVVQKIPLTYTTLRKFSGFLFILCYLSWGLCIILYFFLFYLTKMDLNSRNSWGLLWISDKSEVLTIWNNIEEVFSSNWINGAYQPIFNICTMNFKNFSEKGTS